jgi:DNA-binding HxlR family transcriptional regulator
MPNANYNHLVSEIKSLNLSDQLRLLEEMATMIRKLSADRGTRSILELSGKGKSLWKNMNVKAYIDEERSTWNG